MPQPPRTTEGAPPTDAFVERVLDVVRTLARELGGARAARAVNADASLERDVGLGSLERVELLLRLERELGRPLPDHCLTIDTVCGLARAILEAGSAEPLRLPLPEATPGAASGIGRSVSTIHESLWHHALLDPERVHVHLWTEDGVGQPITYGCLRREAGAIASGLHERGVKAGDTVALMLPTGLDFLRSFLGILVARAIPVPIYPPVRLDRLAEYAQRQAAILADAGARLLVTVDRGRPVARLLRPSVPTLSDVVTADDLAAGFGEWRGPEGRGSDPAFIQYTSGSTGQPKGVLLTHHNLLANIRGIAASLELAPTDVGVSWLPLYHDMGLIGAWLTCLHQGLPLTLLPPTAFLARPERWLWAIHQRRATLSPAPNFAYELCVRRIAEGALAGLDLSSWRCALNGAEPVSPGTVDRFIRRFSPRGFRREAMMPVYGLAECSVALTVPPVGRAVRIDRVLREPLEREGRAVPAPVDDEAAVELVCVGRELPEHELRVVDDAGTDVAERVVGRLVFRGPSMTAGYFKKPEATAAITLPGGWLDSGDLAYRADGELFIAGRLKDVIIKGGRNLVPQEIEEVAAEVEGIRRGCVAAFGVQHPETGTEGLVVVAETRLTDPAGLERLAGAVTARIAEAIDVPPDRVVLVRPGTVPKTSSGKIRRSATRELFQNGSLGEPPPTALGQKLRLAAAAAAEEVAIPLRATGRALYAAYLALTLVPLLGFAWLLAAIVPGRRIVAFVQRATCRLGLALVGCRLTVEGRERLPPRGACVFASNHASYVDVPALVALVPGRLAFVAKKEALSLPLVATFVRRAGHLTVDRFDAQQGLADADQVARALASGERVLFFPEGTFVAATGLRPFRLGAFRTAAEGGVPVVPLALRGTRRVLRGDERLPLPGHIHLWIGEPVVPGGRDWPSIVRLRDQVADAIAARCGEPRLDLVAGGPERPAEE